VSIVPVYLVWLTPELFNFSLVFLAFFLWSYKENGAPAGSGRWAPLLSGPGSDYAAAILLGVATFSKPVHIVLIGPLVALALWRRQWARSARIFALFVAATGLLFMANYVTTGDANYQGGNRKTFYGYTGFPFANPRETFETTGQARATDGVPLDIVVTRDAPTVFGYNLAYFAIGRYSGFVPYFFPGVVSLLLFVAAPRRRPLWQWLTAGAAVIAAIGLILYMPYTYSGGGGPVGNRYYLSFYPLFLFLTPALSLPVAPLAAIAIGALFTAPLVMNPFDMSFDPGAHAKSGPVRMLPIELTQLIDLPVSAKPDRSRIKLAGDPPMLAYFPDDNAYRVEGDAFWVRGRSRADIILRAPAVDDALGTGRPVRLQSLAIEIENGGKANEVRIRTGGENLSVAARAGRAENRGRPSRNGTPLSTADLPDQLSLLDQHHERERLRPVSRNAGVERQPRARRADTTGADVRPGHVMIAGAGLVLAAALLVCLRAILPLHYALILGATVVWFTVPGVFIARVIYGKQPGASIGSWLLGGVWGHAFSSLALLALWVMGLRSAWILLLAPLLAFPVVFLVRPLAGRLTLPHFTRADVLAVLLLLLIVPLVVGRPFARVGADLPDGRAYRAYFTADFVWRMAVAAELSKGDVPPRNQFYLDDPLRYYWLPHLLPAIQYRLQMPPARLEQVLLVNSVVLDLVFVAFFYALTRQLVTSRAAAVAGCVSAVLFTSFEGAERLWFQWRHAIPLDAIRNVNIDAVENWYYGALKIDGLQRLLWYQPHHAMGYAAGLSALLCATQAREVGRFGTMVWIGALLACSLLLSTFAALMLTSMVAIYVGIRLIKEGRYGALVTSASGPRFRWHSGSASPCRSNTSIAAKSLIQLGLNPAATRGVIASLLLNVPMLAASFVGLWIAMRSDAPHATFSASSSACRRCSISSSTSSITSMSTSVGDRDISRSLHRPRSPGTPSRNSFEEGAASGS
jgi:hypothetical protein